MSKAFVVALVAGACFAWPVQGQAPYAVPRTPWGDPDLQGLWPGTAMMGVPMERPLPPSGARAGGPRGGGAGLGPPGHWGERGLPQQQTSLVVDPPDGRIPPMTDEGKRRTAAVPKTWYYDNDGGGPFAAPTDLSAYDRCITRGVVGSMLPVGYNAGNEIVQAPGVLALRNEMIHETRVIPLDGRPHLPGSVRQYMGDGRGRWDGNTLVVETTNFTDKTPYRGSSDQLKMIERFTPLGPDTVEWAVTLDDSRTWARPWTFAMNLTRDATQPPFEYACHEGNYGLRNILEAARAEERTAAGR